MSTDASADSGKSEQDHFFRAAWIVAALTLLSRIFGMVRDMVLVPMARGHVADSFWFAFSIPHMFRRLFGEGALTAAFVPVFTESAEKAGWDRARLVLGNTLGLLAAVLAGITIAIELGLLAWLLLWPGAQSRALSIQLTMLMLPFAVGICLLALMSAAMNAKGHFVYPAAAPIILNLGLIAGSWVAPWFAASKEGQFYVEGVALHVANVAQVLPALWMVRHMGLLGPVCLRPILPEIGAIARKMAPTFIPLSMMQISEQISKMAAMALSASVGSAVSTWSPLAAGVVQCQYAAGRLYQFSMGVLGVSLSTAVFPLLTRYVARGDGEGLRQTITRALRLCFFLGIPTGAGMVALGGPIVEAIFHANTFTGGPDALSDVSRTATMLQMYCLGMPAYFIVHVLLRVFFARKETRAPMIVSSVLGLATVAATVAGFFTPLRHASMGLGTAVVFTLNAAIFGWMIQRRVGRLDWRAILVSAIRVSAATAAMVVATLVTASVTLTGTWWAMHRSVLKGAILTIPLIVGTVVFVAAAFLLRCPELRELRRRKQPAAPAEAEEKKTG